MNRILTTIEGCPVYWDGTVVSFIARGRIDDDGTGSGHGDKYHQKETTLKREGKSLNADTERYVVAPPQIVLGVPGVVMGCRCRVTFHARVVEAVVGDVGPHTRIGEMSIACATALGIDPNPITGGEDAPMVHYQMWPGVAALGYELQRS